MGISYQDIYESTVTKMALQRLVTPEEIAAAAIFLASNESSGITGAVINVDAGSLLNIL
jgi:enoyl-[acyl-carrier-protein] reductase (NADH)